MIAVDSSAVIAILRDEPDAFDFASVISKSDRCCIAAISVLEASMVMAGSRGSDRNWNALDTLVTTAEMEVVPQTMQLILVARQAFLRFGKGRHPAALNMGDCVSYALAKSRGLPLLFKGKDFAQTDLISAH